MRFPKRIRHRGQVLATIYAKTKAFPAYRLAWRVTGKRRMERFQTYSEVKRRADALVKELAQGSHVTALTPRQATDALAALERLQGYFQQTGRRVSLLATVSEWVEQSTRLNGRALPEAIDGYLANVASVKRKDVAEAVEEFIKADEPRTKASNGQRAQLSSEYTRIRALRLRRFAKALPGHAVCDLSKQHLDVFIQAMAEASPKARNHHRAGIKQFIQWSVRNDFLPPSNRLLEADSMRMEHANNGDIGIYTAKEFRALLETADGSLKPLIAIGGLCGLRTAELLRLEWEDVWRVEGHIEISQTKSKTRSRRLVTICPALAEWLRPYRSCSGRLWKLSENCFHAHCAETCKAAGVKRKDNGLRHSFCSFHFALHANENQTAQQAGNSPAMIHGHYKGLATKAEAEKWFNVQPSRAANIIPLAATATE
ncbi:MAG: tyrosine-type recombinase/integrase [Verrucomicrobiota bacterium]